MQDNNSLLETLSASQLYRDYEKAFSEATGLPVALRTVESWKLPIHGKRHESPFCALMAEKSRSCAACLRVQEKLSEGAREEACSLVCEVGLTDTAVPVRLGSDVVGFLQTGQVFRRPPTKAQYERAAELLRQWGVEVEPDKAREAYFGTTVLNGKQYDSMIQLLTIFADHLSILANRICVQKENAEPPMISKARQYIADHQTEDLSLGQVAKAVNASPFYFCKMFRKFTGLNFTAYVSRIRIERSKELLLNPNLRISEIAFEVGFQSLTHFNRVFKKIAGQSPTRYRRQLKI
jgi:AraC-like DNA-binding protein/ligand-binding sensor protein